MSFCAFLSDEGIARLCEHKYVAAGFTPLDLLLDPFWLALANLVPRRISPNVVSLIGGVCALASTMLCVAAGWCQSRALYLLSGFLLSCYVNADAMDGKHARLTLQCSPLGALLDHGIDAFVAFTTGVAICVTVTPGLSTVGIMAGFCCFHTTWFVAQWEMREVGTLDARGVTEGELAAMFLLMLPGFAGLGVYASPIHLPVLGVVPLGQIVEFLVAAGTGLKAVYHVVKTVATQPRISSFTPIVHMMLHDAVCLLLATTVLYKSSPLLTFLVVGMDACLLMTKAAFAATTHSPWPAVFPLDGVPFLVVALGAIAGFHVGTWVVFAVLLWQSVVFALMWSDTISRLCKALDIPFLAELPMKKE